MLVRARVDIKKPDFEGLRNKGFTSVDMHFHTRFSDTYTKVSRAVYNAEKIGIGLAVTDHNVIEGAKLAFKLKETILVVPGIETSSKEGPHLLSYFSRIRDLEGFYESCVKENLANDPYLRTKSNVRDILWWTKEFGGIVSAAHPFCPGMMGLHKAVKRKYVPEIVMGEIDAIEVMTGVNMKAMTYRSIQLAEDLKKPITGGSDGHSLFELGSVVTSCKAKTLRTFLKEIMAHRSFVSGKETRLASRVPSYTKTTNKHLKYIKPFIGARARTVMKESVYYHSNSVNKTLKKIAKKGVRIVKKG